MKRSDKWMEAARRQDERDNIVRIKKAAAELEVFLESNDGIIAVHQLLRVANRHIVFGAMDKVHPNESLTMVALVGGLDGGLRRYDEEFINGALVSEKYVKIERASALLAAGCAVRFKNIEPENVMPWLFDELDKIADSIT